MKICDAIRMEGKIGIERHIWNGELSLVLINEDDKSFYYLNNKSCLDKNNKYIFSEDDLLASDWIPVLPIID